MNNRSKGTRWFLQFMSFFMLVFAVFLGVGTKFVDFMFGFNSEMLTTSFWVLFAISTVLTFVMFYSSSSISTNKEFGSNDDFKLKVKNIKEVNVITGLEYSDDFLDEHFLDKKYNKVIKKLKNKIEKVKKKADRNGFNLYEPEKMLFRKKTWYWPFNKEKKYNKVLKKYMRLKEKHDSPTLKEETKYTYVKGIYRVTRAYLSDGIKKYSVNDDPDKPVSGMSVQARKGSQKLALSLMITIAGANVGYKLLTDGFSNDFWIDLAMKLVAYSITIVNGFMFGKTYFNDVFLDFEIKRENLLQKYVRWLKSNHPEAWNSSLQEKKDLQQREIEATASAKLKQIEVEFRAKEIETSMLEAEKLKETKPI